MRTLLVTSAALLFVAGSASAQPKIFIEPEVGVNSSMFPKVIRASTSAGRRVKERYLPLVSPVMGVWATLSLKKHFYISTGIQLNRSGEIYKRQTRNRNPVTGTDELTTDRERFEFDKFSFPIVLGYRYRIRNFNGTFFLGYKHIAFMKGEYAYERVVFDPTFNYAENFSPFDHRNLAIAARSRSRQYMAGVGAYYKKKFYVSLNFAYGDAVYFEEVSPPGAGWDGTGYSHRYERGDVTLTCRYLLSITGTGAK